MKVLDALAFVALAALALALAHVHVLLICFSHSTFIS